MQGGSLVNLKLRGGVGTKSRHPVLSFVSNTVRDEINVRVFNDYNASTMCSYNSCQIYVNEVLLHEK